MTDKIILVTFTDPMMGLSYECEPIFRKLETHFADRIEFRYVMSGLVRDVYELVTPDELKFGKELAIKLYNARLAEIYRSEENLGGLPINMTGFELFSTAETSSDPLNIAYKAAQLVDANKADEFLYRLRFATIVDCRPTTRTSEILKVVIKSGLDHKKFLTAYNDGSAEKNFQNDLQLCRRIGIHELPSYMLQYQSKGALIRGLASFDDFANVIDDLSGIKPESPVKSLGTLRELIAKHRLISPIEIREAFDFKSVDEVQKFIAPLVDSHEIKIVDVPHGWFIETEALA
ncbi:MAG: DsbA family protein [Selenomonadaceae bacterium]|nr:DsbA family protein [Selenomonadaceae bacterium]